MQLDSRKQAILNAIISEFIKTAEPVGSKSIVINYYLHVSPATIRNDMANLEKEGLIYQPHISAGRIPTNAGYRNYIDNFPNDLSIQKLAKNLIQNLKHKHHLTKVQEKIYDLVSILAEATLNISFATIPGKERTFYLGVSNILKQPEFQQKPMNASQIIEVFEEKDHFIAVLEKLNINNDIQIFVGEENILKEMESCSLIVSKYNYEGYQGFIGILGPTRMNYPLNSAILKEVKNILTTNK